MPKANSRVVLNGILLYNRYLGYMSVRVVPCPVLTIRVIENALGLYHRDLYTHMMFLALIILSLILNSAVAPICYAHLAAAQVSQFIKFDEISDRSSSHSGTTSGGGTSVTPIPRLHQNVASSMFFC